MSEERFKNALKQIDGMDLGLRVKEVIRRAFHPDEPCPQCRGAGEVPRIGTPDCGLCMNYSTSGPYSGNYSKGHNIRDEIDSICRDDFEASLPMQECPSCRGKKEKVVIANGQS